MKRVLAALVALLLVAVPVAAGLWWMSGEDREPAEVRAVVPDSIVYWAEAPDVRASWASMQGTEALSELRASGMIEAIVDSFRTSEDTKSFRDSVARSGIALDGESFLRFAGQRWGIALEPRADGSTVDALAVSRIDRVALAKELLGNGQEVGRLWAELRSRSGNAGLAVTVEGYQDYDLAEFRSGEDAVWGVLMEDLLVVATSRELLVRSVDVRLGDGTGSLATHAPFIDEVAKLPADAAMIDWVDLAGLREQRETLAKALRGTDDSWLATAATEILDDTASAPSLARAFRLPEGDLYQLDWTSSRSFEELYGPRAESLALGQMFGDDLMSLVEVDQPARLYDAYQSSSTRRRVDAFLNSGEGSDPLWEFIDEQMEESLAEQEQSLFGDEGDYRSSVRFLGRMTANLVRRQFDAALAGQGALAFGMSEEGPQFAAVTRLDSDGRMAASLLIAERVAAGDAMVEDEGDLRLVFPVGEAADQFVIGLHRDVIAVASSREDLTTALGGASAVEHEDVRAARSMLADDALLRWFFRSERIDDLVDDPLLDGPSKQVFGRSDWMAMGCSVHERMDWMRMDFVAEVPEKLAQRAGSDLDARSRQPLDGLAMLPRDSMLAMGGGASPAWFLELMRDLMSASDRADAESEYRIGPPPETRENFDNSLREMSADLGIDVEGTWLPSLSGELAMGVVQRPARRLRRAPNVPEAAYPDLVLLLGLANRAPTDTLLTGLESYIAGVNEENGSRSPIQRTTLVGRDVYWLDLPRDAAEAVGVAPDLTWGVVDDWLVLASSRDTFKEVVAAAGGDGFGASPLMESARGAGLGGAAQTGAFWSIRGLIETVADSPTLLSSIVPTDDDLPYPEFDENDDMESWERKQLAYQAEMERRGEEAAKEWTETLRATNWVDWIGFETVYDGEVARSSAVIHFGSTPTTDE